MSHITAADFADTYQPGSAQLVDVREPSEFAVAHVPGARLIPMAQLVDRLSEIDRSQPVFVICHSGGRSSAMTDVLRHQGFDARSVDGGTAAWILSGRPVEPDTTEGK